MADFTSLFGLAEAGLRTRSLPRKKVPRMPSDIFAERWGCGTKRHGVRLWTLAYCLNKGHYASSHRRRLSG